MSSNYGQEDYNEFNFWIRNQDEFDFWDYCKGLRLVQLQDQMTKISQTFGLEAKMSLTFGLKH